ncbi:MAG: hypothetical protein KatS3mg104_0780 [Phycisphaerae bacterium]|jgi:hypothetical protein|nr:MAG: hypothetical protein KatS3mg104_0780 [Phycisphaerae bacterium]
MKVYIPGSLFAKIQIRPVAVEMMSLFPSYRDLAIKAVELSKTLRRIGLQLTTTQNARF